MESPVEQKKFNKYYKYVKKPPTCVDCGLFMPDQTGQRKRCDDCRQKEDTKRQIECHKKKRLKESPLLKKKCKRCGNEFKTRSRKIVNCCKKKDKTCVQCNAPFNDAWAKYCRDCAKNNYLKRMQEYHAKNRKRTATNARYEKKNCIVCTCEFDSYLGIAKYCVGCRPTVYYQQNRDSAKRIKEKVWRRPQRAIPKEKAQDA